MPRCTALAGSADDPEEELPQRESPLKTAPMKTTDRISPKICPP
jgi:hypothetical protein